MKRAEQLDAAFPGCACEPWSLRDNGKDGLSHTEKIARLLTSPDAYKEDTGTIITGKLTQIYSLGMSLVRQGASDAEITTTVHDLLTGAAEDRTLVGAVVMPVSALRAYANDDDYARWFGVYATDDRSKTHHADVLGTTVSRAAQSRRRGKLATDMESALLLASSCDDLITKLRDAGI